MQPDAIRLAPPLILRADQAEKFLSAFPAILDQAAAAAEATGSAPAARPGPARGGTHGAGGAALTSPIREA